MDPDLENSQPHKNAAGIEMARNHDFEKPKSKNGPSNEMAWKLNFILESTRLPRRKLVSMQRQYVLNQIVSCVALGELM